MSKLKSQLLLAGNYNEDDLKDFRKIGLGKLMFTYLNDVLEDDQEAVINHLRSGTLSGLTPAQLHVLEATHEVFKALEELELQTIVNYYESKLEYENNR